MRTPFLLLLLLLAGCGSSSSSAPPLPSAPAAPVVNVDADIKQLIFNWAEIPDATHYRLLANSDGHSGFTQVGLDIPAGTLSVNLPIAVHLHDFINALYMVQACNDIGCNGSSEVNAMNVMLDTIGYFKASNTGRTDHFGSSIAISLDGSTLVVGAPGERSNATGINGDQNDNLIQAGAGAVYVFRFDGTDWGQQAYIKPSNSPGGRFGHSIAVSSDGNTLAVGAYAEDSNATGINGDQNDNSAATSGAVYLFRFDGTEWSQHDYIKASNTDVGDMFGHSVALSEEGDTLAVGAWGEDSNATGINGDQNDNSASGAGAVYVFRFDGTEWSQHEYVKASNAGSADAFGKRIAVSADGNTLAVGAVREESAATSINGDQLDNSAPNAGAAYVFRFDGMNWSQQAYIKASNTDSKDFFGGDIAISADGNTLAVGAEGEKSEATGINGNQNDNSAILSGAVYIFRFDGAGWFQEAYAKASNSEEGDYFGLDVTLSGDGNTLAVGAPFESSNAVGTNGDQNDNSNGASGAAYIFAFDGFEWTQITYIKHPHPLVDPWISSRMQFGLSILLSVDGNNLFIGAPYENSAATGVNGDPSTLFTFSSSSAETGAVYFH